jgi:hypothetical protein
LFDSYWWRFLFQKHHFPSHFVFRSRINRRIATCLPDHTYIPYHSSDISAHRSAMMAALLFAYLAPQTIILKLIPFIIICLADQSASEAQVPFYSEMILPEDQSSGISPCFMKNYDSSFFRRKISHCITLSFMSLDNHNPLIVFTEKCHPWFIIQSQINTDAIPKVESIAYASIHAESLRPVKILIRI